VVAEPLVSLNFGHSVTPRLGGVCFAGQRASKRWQVAYHVDDCWRSRSGEGLRRNPEIFAYAEDKYPVPGLGYPVVLGPNDQTVWIWDAICGGKQRGLPRDANGYSLYRRRDRPRILAPTRAHEGQQESCRRLVRRRASQRSGPSRSPSRHRRLVPRDDSKVLS